MGHFQFSEDGAGAIGRTTTPGIGGSVMWYDAANLTSTVQENLDIRCDGVPGRGGEWVDVFLNWRYTF